MIGGSIEEGEMPIQAAIRECREELGEKAIFNKNKLSSRDRVFYGYKALETLCKHDNMYELKFVN